MDARVRERVHKAGGGGSWTVMFPSPSNSSPFATETKLLCGATAGLDVSLASAYAGIVALEPVVCEKYLICRHVDKQHVKS